MAVGAHEIPVHADATPVELITGSDCLPGIEKKPSLAAKSTRPAVPCYAKRLQTSSRHRNQILLQRTYAESIFEFVIVQCTIRAIGADHEFLAVAEESRGDSSVFEIHMSEIAQNR